MNNEKQIQNKVKKEIENAYQNDHVIKKLVQSNRDEVALKLALVLSVIIAIISVKASVQLIMSWFNQPILGFQTNVMVATVLSSMTIVVLIFNSFQFKDRFKDSKIIISMFIYLLYFIFGMATQNSVVNIWSYFVFLLAIATSFVVFLLGKKQWEAFKLGKAS